MLHKHAKFVDVSFKGLLWLCIGATLTTTTLVVVILGTEAYHFFSLVPITEFLFGTHWEPLIEPRSFGVLPLVCGTGMIVLGSIAFALPIGLGIATYLSEFAPNWVRSTIKPTLEILAGIPTVVYGYFALTFITPILRSLFPETEIFNAASGAIVVGIMILPMISSLCDDAFRGLPSSLREGGYALGATPYEVVTRVVLPAAGGRIGAAVILAVSRAIGETMAVTLAAGASPNLTANPFESIQTMTAYIVQVSLGDTPVGGVEYLTCFAVAGLLFTITFIMNVIGSQLLLKTQWQSRS